MYTVVWGRNTREQPHFIKLAQTFGEGDATRWPEEGPDMTLLDNDHEKQRQWRKTAGDLLAKELGHYNSQLPLHVGARDRSRPDLSLSSADDNANHWMLADLPRGYALFQQVTHPKADQKGDPREGGKRDGGKRLRLDRFIFGARPSFCPLRPLLSLESLGRVIVALTYKVENSGNQVTRDARFARPSRSGDTSAGSSSLETGRVPAMDAK